MNILFLSLLDYESIEERNIYTDLLREFWKEGHKLYIISPVEKRTGKKTHILKTDKAVILKPRIFNMQKTGYIEKALSMFTIESILTRAIKSYFAGVKFDLVLYATPPISFYKPIRHVKKRDNAITYLLQKDIFPEGLLDLQVLTTSGWRRKIYNYYRKKEINLLEISDFIGCMSQANVNYIVEHNDFLDPSRVELCPNSIEVIDKSVDEKKRIIIRKKYGIPINKKVLIYGGNLGKPQGIPFLIECIKACHDTEDVFFLIVGDGTEYDVIDNYIKTKEPQNVKLMKRLPKDDYDTMVGACDVGMIFLDHRFTIPNFPSRLLSYMQAKIPVLACTDPITDIGEIIEQGGFGWWCESNDSKQFKKIVNEIKQHDLIKPGYNAYEYLENNYSVSNSYKVIMNRIKMERYDDGSVF